MITYTLSLKLYCFRSLWASLYTKYIPSYLYLSLKKENLKPRDRRKVTRSNLTLRGINDHDEVTAYIRGVGGWVHSRNLNGHMSSNSAMRRTRVKRRAETSCAVRLRVSGSYQCEHNRRAGINKQMRTS